MFKTTGFRLWVEAGSLPCEPVLGVNASISNHVFTLFSVKTHLFGQIWTRVRHCLQHLHLPMRKKTHPADKLANPLFFLPICSVPSQPAHRESHPGAWCPLFFFKQQIHHLQEASEVIWFTGPSQKNLVGSLPGACSGNSWTNSETGSHLPQRIASASLNC